MNWDRRIREQDLDVGVVGLGYVGLPLAAAFARAGFTVLGFDTDPGKVETIESGESPIPDVPSDTIGPLRERGDLRATADMQRMGAMDALIICVPTPLRKSRDPDISYIVEVTEVIARFFEPPGIIVLESTTYPGTTEDVLAREFEAAGWDLRDDVHLAFSPERIDPANEEYSIEDTPKVVGGFTEESGRLVSDLYGRVIDRVVTVSNTRSAEMVKLLENTFRSINIGLANEMALICDRLDINVWEVIDAASTKPYGFMPFYPGPGLGGHCIPVDPLFLSWRARLADSNSRFIELADEVNRSMPSHVCNLVTETLNEKSKAVRGTRVCLFGVAYKPGVDDTRESPAMDVVAELRELGADLVYCDPYVDEFTVADQPVARVRRGDVPDESFDLGLILTDHTDFDWSRLLASIPQVVDTRDALPDDFDPGSTQVVLL